MDAWIIPDLVLLGLATTAFSIEPRETGIAVTDDSKKSFNSNRPGNVKRVNKPLGQRTLEIRLTGPRTGGERKGDPEATLCVHLVAQGEHSGSRCRGIPMRPAFVTDGIACQPCDPHEPPRRRASRQNDIVLILAGLHIE